MIETPAFNKGRTGISFEAVASIAESIVAEGGKPTLRGIRERLGTGSLGTIQQHLSAWRGEHQPATAGATLPDNLQRSLAAEIERQRAEARAELLEQLSEAQATIDALTDENTRLTHALNQETDRSAQYEKLVERLDAEKAMLKETLDHCETAQKALQASIEELRQQLALANMRLETYANIKEEENQLYAKIEDEKSLRMMAEAKAERYEERATLLADQLTEIKVELTELKKKEEAYHEADKLNEILKDRLELAAREIQEAKNDRQKHQLAEQNARATADQLQGRLDIILRNQKTEAKPKSPKSKPKSEERSS